MFVVSDILEEEASTYKMMVAVFAKLDIISSFVRERERDRFAHRSQVNMMCVLLWHLAFLHHLMHPRVSMTTWNAEDLELRSYLVPQQCTKLADRQEQLQESTRYLQQQIARFKDAAEQQVRARNSQEALQERGTWFTMDWMSSMTKLLNDEGWARMRWLEVMLSTTTHGKALGVHNQYRAQFDWIRDWIIFSLFVNLPPMQPQNGNLQILGQLKPAGIRETNGVVFLESRAYIQIVKFKNAASHGEFIIDLPKELCLKLLAYACTVWPVYVHASCQTRIDNDNEDEDEESDDDLELDDENDNKEETSWIKQGNVLMQGQHGQILEEVSAWRSQSTWLFLKPGNRPLCDIGKRWTNFMRENTGQQTNLRVWQKVVETASSTRNTISHQETLSRALLHQHQTGREY